jgi:hypothetical protein
MGVSYINFNTVYVYEIYGKCHLWPYVNQALLLSNITENWNFPTTFYENISYLIPTLYLIHGHKYL